MLSYSPNPANLHAAEKVPKYLLKVSKEAHFPSLDAALTSLVVGFFFNSFARSMSCWRSSGVLPLPYFLFGRGHIGQPEPLVRQFPCACHSCPQVEHFHNNFLLVPAITLSAGNSFLSEYSLASSG